MFLSLPGFFCSSSKGIPLTLSYSSGSVDESHNVQATAPWVGEGWNLSLGFIGWAEEDVTPGGTNRIESVWHISDPTGISGQLTPPDLQAATADTVAPSPLFSPYIWHTADPIDHPTAEAFSSSAGSGWRCYGYDQRGQLDQSTLAVTADSTTTTQTVNMSYNDGGEITQLVYPGSGANQILTSQYDANGRFQSAYFGSSSTPDPVDFLVASTGYTGAGQIKSLSLGGSGPKNNGGSVTPVLQMSMSYDGIQRPLSTSASENGTTIWNQTRTYDNVGNVLQLSTTIPTSSGTLLDNQSFCYDALNRLKWAGDTGNPTGGDHCGNAPTGTTISTSQQSFSYDDLDRMTSGPMGTVGYNNSHVHAVNSLSSIPNKYATYDDMGNMTCRNVDPTTAHICSGSTATGAIMTYDNEGRLATWTAPTGTTASDSFLYDNEGNRVLQRTSDSNGVTDTITFDGYSEKVINGSSTTTSKFYSVNGMRLAMRQASTLYYLLPDLLGSPTVALTSSGSFQAVQLFNPYGTSRYSSGNMPTDYNFTGQRLDSETGLIYENFRYYDPISGRFVRADTTLTNAMGMDGYAYVMDNPEGKTDPTGHCPWCIGAIVGAVIGAAVSYGVQVYNNYQNHVQNPWTQNIDVTSIVAGALTGALIGATLGVGLAAGAAVYAGGATVVEAAQTGAWVAAMDLAYGTGEMIQSAQNDAQNEDQFALTEIERARLRARFYNFKSTSGIDRRTAGVIAQTADPTGQFSYLEISGVSGSPVSDPYYGTGTCAEFNCAINGKVWLQNIDSSDRGDINLYLWHKNGLPPCASCEATLQNWANAWGQPINVSWLEGEDQILTSDSYTPNLDAGLSDPRTHGGW